MVPYAENRRAMRWMTNPLDGDRSSVAVATIGLLVVVLGFTCLFSLASGASDASSWAVIRAWLSGNLWDSGVLSESERIIVTEIRMPRMAMGLLIGAALAVSGAVMQGLFRNPLADPGIVGVSAGASLGAVSVIVLGSTMLAPLTQALGIYALPLAAFCGGLASTIVLYRVSTRQGRTSVATMLLAGIALGALAMALTGIMIFMADDRQLRDLTFWQLGSLAGATWTKVGAIAPIIVLTLVVCPFLARGLNALSLGEATAAHLGIPVQRFKYLSIFTVAAATGAAVAVSGGIGFVGILVPHLVRLLSGPGNR